MSESILTENLLENGTVVASDTGSGYSVDNVYDRNTYDHWAPSAIGPDQIDLTLASPDSADCFVLFAHNLGTVGASIKLQWGDGASPEVFTDLFSAISPGDDRIIFKTFTAVSKNNWRVVIDSTGATGVPIIGMIAFGSQLTFPVGLPTNFAPPTRASDKESKTNLSRGAAFLGRSIRNRSVPFTARLRTLDAAWVTANWDALRDHLDALPFFFSFDISDVNEAVFCWKRDSAPARLNHVGGAPAYMETTLQLEGEFR